MYATTVAIILVAVVTGADAESLHQTFARGSDEMLLELVKGNPRLIDQRDDSKCIALHHAARYGRVKTAKWLIEHKADVNAAAYNNFTPMHLVKDAAVAKLLIQGGAKLNVKDAWGKTPLQNAAQEGNEEVAESILKSGYPIDLASALWLKRRDVVKRIIKDNPMAAKTATEDSDLWGNTSPLGIATANRDKEIVELLLKAGAPVNAVTNRPIAGPLTALSNAVLAGDFEIAKLLCEAGADCNVAAGKFFPRLLDYALKHSDKPMIDLLVKFGGRSSEERNE